MKNIPYKKEYGEFGELLNPIEGYYQSRVIIGYNAKNELVTMPNRSERRRVERLMMNHGYAPSNNRKKSNKRGKNPRGRNLKRI